MNLLKRFFGRREGQSSSESFDIVKETLMGIFDIANFDFSYDLQQEDDDILVDIYGKDEDLLKKRNGQLLDALQFFTKRVLQHQIPERKIYVQFDSKGFRSDSDKRLLGLADKLKVMAIKNKKSVYCKPLPPKERRIIHQHLLSDRRVRTKSIGDGHYKKIKIIPTSDRDFRDGPSHHRRRYK